MGPPRWSGGVTLTASTRTRRLANLLASEPRGEERRWTVQRNLDRQRAWRLLMDDCAMTRELAVRPLLSALTILLLVWLLAGCATARPTSLVRTPTGYEVLSAQCPAAAELCSAIRVTGDPHDEEAWGFRARPGAGSLWKESQILYAVGNRMRCDEVRAALHTPSEGCWGPVYFRREGR